MVSLEPVSQNPIVRSRKVFVEIWERKRNVQKQMISAGLGETDSVKQRKRLRGRFRVGFWRMLRLLV